MTTKPRVRPVLRVDAERNRAALVCTARQVFAERGLDVSMAEVARQAGVGMATLYRRFPTRESLVVDAFDDKMTTYLDAVDVALAESDPWRGFCDYIERVCVMQHGDRGFANVLTMTFPDEVLFEDKRAVAYRGFEKLISKAKKAGRLRPEFRSQDLVVLLMANAGVVAGSGDAAAVASRRLVSYFLTAAESGSVGELAPAPSTREMEAAMRRGGDPEPG
ncbi:TetR family transcriptional regulator [Williamsia limnetica]|uniref:TetR family transcriptional regulator n=1 Tax=Williamsia limnetica TaxID=882452 RepID=A0A318RLY3_WILLI|nr:TetR/AcrR family transcriptional regulator [Williamsia limnetica]PYE16920.1 TetR family transcriptional regulator [Williamsia limnetica]